MRRGPRTRARRREGVGRPPLDSASVQPPIRANGTLPRGSSGSLPFRYYPVHLILWDSPSQRRRRSTRRRTPPAPKSVDTAPFDLGNRRRKARRPPPPATEAVVGDPGSGEAGAPGRTPPHRAGGAGFSTARRARPSPRDAAPAASRTPRTGVG